MLRFKNSLAEAKAAMLTVEGAVQLYDRYCLT